MEAIAQKKSELPRAIQDQADAADAAVKKLAEGTLVAVEEPKPDLEPEKPVTTPEKPEKPKDGDAAYWKHRFEVVEGLFKNSDKKKDEQISQLLSTVQNLNDLLIKKGPEETPATEEKETSTEVQGRLDPEDFEGYGGEMVEMVELVNSLVEENKRLRSLSDEMGSTVEKVGTSFQKTEGERFYSALTDQVEDWRTINTDPAWLAWLDENDPRSDIWRQTLLDDAFKALDVKRVAILFNDFIKETNWQKPSSSEQPGKTGKEDLVVPDTTPTPEVIEETGSGITAAEFKQASVDFTQGRITEEQYKKISDNFQRSLAKGKK